ncbi:MAG TPA: AAA family ATPase, partial [Chloroflexota bacterium]|nr:AAA family ATPase [Chloroflexota bacterium]
MAYWVVHAADATIVGSGAWRRALDDDHQGGFRFESPRGHFTARREARRNVSYWYAYRKSQGKIYKLYLGRSSELTRERLDDVAQTLQARLETTSGASAPMNVSDGRLTSNLPLELSSFVGRDAGIATVRQLLETQHLVTLVGVGGVGKTRLALRVARGMRDHFSDGIWLTELASVSEPRIVPQTVASALGITELAGRRIAETLAGELARRQALLVLDNCEHLRAACAELVAWLLKSCPRLTILATSREPLGVAGEHVWLTAPLTLPVDDEPATASEAVRLFVERATEAQPHFQLNPRNADAV